MKKFNWLTTFLLNVVTCGIYSIYAWYVMTENNNKIAADLGVNEKRMNFILVVLLSSVTCGILPIIWYYRFMRQQVAIANAVNVKAAPTESPIVLLIITFVPVYSFYVLCDNYNRTVEAYEAR